MQPSLLKDRHKYSVQKSRTRAKRKADPFEYDLTTSNTSTFNSGRFLLQFIQSLMMATKPCLHYNIIVSLYRVLYNFQFLHTLLLVSSQDFRHQIK